MNQHLFLRFCKLLQEQYNACFPVSCIDTESLIRQRKEREEERKRGREKERGQKTQSVIFTAFEYSPSIVSPCDISCTCAHQTCFFGCTMPQKQCFGPNDYRKMLLYREYIFIYIYIYVFFSLAERRSSLFTHCESLVGMMFNSIW